MTWRCGDQNRARRVRDLVEPSVWLRGRPRRGPRAVSGDGAQQDRRGPAAPATQPSPGNPPRPCCCPRPFLLQGPEKGGAEGGEGRAGRAATRARAGELSWAAGPLRRGAWPVALAAPGGLPGRPRVGAPPGQGAPVLLPSCQSTAKTAERLPSTANQPSIQLIRQSFLNSIFITVSLF